MTSLIKQKETCCTTEAQCCAKLSSNVAGCHD